MLVRMDNLVSAATREGYGIAAPNVFGMDSVALCFEAALHQRAVLIISDKSDKDDLEEVAAVTRFFAQKYPQVPVALNLDHAETMEMAILGIRYGYTNVMLDFGELPLEENAAGIKELVRLAHGCGVSVEAALGGAERGASFEEVQASMTDVEQARWFCRETGVDALAVGVGAAHGDYGDHAPVIDFPRIEALRDALAPNTSLVIHGTSFTGDENLRKMAQCGIAKFNIFGELSKGAVQGICRVFEKGNITPRHLHQFNRAIRDGYRGQLEHYMQLLGSAHRW